MTQMSSMRKDILIKYYSKLFFKESSHDNWSNIRWPTSHGITFVTMWDEEHLYNNIRLCMMKQLMGKGPTRYCIMNNRMPNLAARLLLLILFLPHQKMSFYPSPFVLTEPFRHPPWIGIFRAMQLRPMCLKNPLFRATYYTQQFVVFIKTGIHRPIYPM